MIIKILLLAVGLVVFILQPAFSGETLEIPGSGGCEVLLRALAQGFNARNPGREVIVPPSIDSSGGIHRVASGRAVLGRISRALDEREKALGLDCVTFARDLIVFLVNDRVNIDNLTKTQLEGIFAGCITNWEEVGAKPGLIRVLIREPSDASLLIIRRKIPAFREIVFGPESKMVFKMVDMRAMLRKYKNSIGWITWTSIAKDCSGLRPLKIDHASPTAENLETQNYQISQDVNLICYKNRLNKLARDFILFIFSDAGRTIINDQGAIPVKRDAYENLK